MGWLRAAARGLVLAVAVAGLAACGDGETTEAAAPVASASAGGSPLSVRDPWIKAADSGMTAVFGTLVNDGNVDLTVLSASTSVTPMMELHETTMVGGAMQMQPKAGGFLIPAGGSHELQPGGDHLMIMDLTTPVRAGDQVEVTLTLSDGETVTFSAVGKPFTGAQESYAPGHGASGMPGMPSASPSAG